MMQTYLFDDKGELWDGKSRQLADALHASLSSEDLLKYVVRNLGFIAVTENNGSLRLQLRPAVVSQMALGGLLYWMHDRDIERVLISSLDEEWSHELVRIARGGGAPAARARKSATWTDREGDFLNQAAAAASICNARARFARLLEAWAECDGKYDRERLHPVIQKAVNGRFVLVEASPNSPALFVKEVGWGIWQLRQILAVTIHRPAGRRPARLRLRQVGGGTLPAGAQHR